MPALVYAVYGVLTLGAFAVFLAMPHGGPARKIPPVLMGAASAIALIVILLRQFAGSAGQNASFAILGLLALVGAVRVITHPKPVYAVLYFVLVALASATMVLLVGAQFLFVAIVAVYAGAILVTYVFVIMLAQQPHDDAGMLGTAADYDRRTREPALAVLAGFLLMGIISGEILDRPWGSAPDSVVAQGHTAAIGRLLTIDYAVSLEVAGVLLLVAMVGAIVMAQKKILPDENVMPAANVLPPGEAGKHVKPF